MRIHRLVSCAVLGAFALAAAPRAFAEDAPEKKEAKPQARLLVVGDGVARFRVTHEVPAARLTFVLEDPPSLVMASPPVVVFRTAQGPKEVTLTAVEGRPGVWAVTHESFRTKTVSGRIRLLVNGKPCEASLRGGQFVTVEGGPQFEVVPDPAARRWTFYAVDETVAGKPYAIEQPQVLVTTAEGPRTVELVPVEGEPRAWRLVGLDAEVGAPLDARFQFTLFGKTLDTHIGLSGLGNGLR